MSEVNPFNPFAGPIKKFYPEIEEYMQFQNAISKMDVGEYPLRDEYVVKLPFVYKGNSYIKGQKIKMYKSDLDVYSGMVEKIDDSFKDKTFKFISAYQDFFEGAKKSYDKNPFKCIYTKEIEGQLYLIVRNE